MYNWRKWPDEAREIALRKRKAYCRPWHAPPHFDYSGDRDFIVTAACYEHAHIIGKSSERMKECEQNLIEICGECGVILHAWCVLPNHYHLLVRARQITVLLKQVGKFHGASSFKWNGEDNRRGRKVWYRSVERSIQSDRHFYATLNYIHHNPVKHGYVEKWQGWPFSSAMNYLTSVGTGRATEIWKEYPVLDYGKDWDTD